jgi:hypothetical protein
MALARPNAKIEADPGNAEVGMKIAIRKQVDGRLLGLRVNRYSWWTHWRELADYILPRRYKWLITPNMMARGSPINGHILDSTATLAARNLASGMMSGITSPTRPWFKLKIGRVDSTQTSPTSIWLSECERLLNLVFAESNFYNSMAVLYLDLVIFGTGVMLIYEDFDDVIRCYNPCAGEYYLAQSDKFRVNTIYREFTLTIDQVVKKFGIENCSQNIKSLYNTGEAALSKEVLIAHAIEPNTDGRKFGVPENFKWREVYWEWGQSQQYLLSKRGFIEFPGIAPRWDLVSNDDYGRSPAMDALPDVKQLQQEVKRKAQAIDKLVNPPMVADVQLKNQPASLLPGGVTYVTGLNNVGFKPVYTVAPPVQEIMEDLNEVRARIKSIFFNDVLQPISQFETKSNVSATEMDIRRSEGLVMLGPVLERVYDEGIKPVIERVFAIASRAGILPPAPPQIAGQPIQIEFVSMLQTAQSAAATGGIERLFQFAGGLVGVDPAVMDNLDIDYGLDKYSSLLNNDPKLIRAPAELAQIRANRQQQQQRQEQINQAEQLAKGAQTLSQADVGNGKNALQSMMGS